MSSSYSQSIPLIATGANNFNQKEMEMTMTQKCNTFVSPSLRKQRNQPGNRRTMDGFNPLPNTIDSE
ncbi:hypothetical protein YC2023_109090 [Brassica napus]